MKMWLKRIALILAVCAAIPLAMMLDVQLENISKLAPSVEAVQPAPTAIVLGAAIQGNDEPSDALRDRLLVAQDLYQRHLVSSILVSGDDGKYRADEVKVMKTFLLDHDVPGSAIMEDGEGYRTYESCKRAVQTFGVKKAIVITQRFHIGRALYLCNHLGLDATGVSSDLESYRRIDYFIVRDLAASVEAWWDINVHAPKSPVAGV